jgi:hypothetical protein
VTKSRKKATRATITLIRKVFAPAFMASKKVVVQRKRTTKDNMLQRRSRKSLSNSVKLMSSGGTFGAPFSAQSPQALTKIENPSVISMSGGSVLYPATTLKHYGISSILSCRTHLMGSPLTILSCWRIGRYGPDATPGDAVC